MRWSTGRGKYGPVDDVLNGTWSEFCGLLQDAAQVPYPADDKDSWYWFAPLQRFPGATQRRNEDVSHMAAWFGGDLDEPGWDIDRLRCKLVGLTWLAYTTTNSTPDAMRWRIMTGLDREYPADDHSRVWRYMNSKFDGQLCSSTKNPSRIFYLPASWDGEQPVFECSYGRPIQVDSVLAMVPPENAHLSSMPYASTLKAAPNGVDIITPHMLADARVLPEGGRMYKLLCGAAKRFRIEGWALTRADLVQAALGANNVISPGKPRKDIDREAQRAMDWAARHFTPQSPIERMRSRVLWEARRFGR